MSIFMSKLFLLNHLFWVKLHSCHLLNTVAGWLGG